MYKMCAITYQGIHFKKEDDEKKIITLPWKKIEWVWYPEDKVSEAELIQAGARHQDL